MTKIRKILLVCLSACLLTCPLLTAGIQCSAAPESEESSKTKTESGSAAKEEKSENSKKYIESGNFRFSHSRGGGLSLVKYTGSESEVTVPDEVNGESVVLVSADAFIEGKGTDSDEKNTTIKKLSFGKNVREFYKGNSTQNDDYYSFTSNPLTFCRSLEAIEVSPENENYCTVDGVLYSKDKKVLYQCPPGKTGTVTVPEGVEKIPEMAFQYSSVSHVNLPESLQFIGRNAFYDADSLEDIVIPSETGIVTSAFYGCDSLKKVVICDGVTDVGTYAFGNCSSLEEIVVPASVKEGGYLLSYVIDFDSYYDPEPYGVIKMYGEAGSHTQELFSDKSYVEFVPLTPEKLKAMEQKAKDERKLPQEYSVSEQDNKTTDNKAQESRSFSESSAASESTPGVASESALPEESGKKKSTDAGEASDKKKEGSSDAQGSDENSDGKASDSSAEISKDEKASGDKKSLSENEDKDKSSPVVLIVMFAAALCLLIAVPLVRRNSADPEEYEELNEEIDDESDDDDDDDDE